ncbi:hypothetical protein PMAYCL1PPCAC_08676, partial [Pristionchus mayeri]
DSLQLAESMISHPGIVSVHSIMILVSIIGLCLMLVILSAIATYRVFQINLRLLLCSLCAIVIFRTLSSLVRASYFLSLAGRTNCEQTWLVWRCQSYSIIIAGPGMVTGTAFLAVAVERIIALVLGKKYEDTNIPIVGVIASLIVWFEYLYTAIFELIALNGKHQGDNHLLPYCTSVSHHGLSLTTRLVIPCAVSFFLLYVITIVGSFLASTISSHDNKMMGTIVKELCSLAFNCYSIIFPLILWMREPRLKLSLRREPLQLNEPPVAAHFDVVTKMWECALPTRSRS